MSPMPPEKRPPAVCRARLSGRESERGAVAIIVTLCLVAIMAMLVLTMDVGTLLLTRRAMVNAADAAALAAAQSCGLHAGEVDANGQIVKYAQDNSDGSYVAAGSPTYTPNCDAASGTVTVRLKNEESLAFAPVLGFSDQATVGTAATAVWGGSGSTEHVAPLMLSATRLTDCEIPPDPGAPFEPKTCSFWWNNGTGGPPSGTALDNAEWGTLDLNKWNVQPTDQCNASTPPEFSEWMFQGFAGALPINPPPQPTYVCRGQGNFGASLDSKLLQARDEGLHLIFPVNDPSKQIDSTGHICTPTTAGCSTDKYDIIGFAYLVITDLYKGNTPEATNYCVSRIPGAEAKSTARCMLARWDGYTTGGINPDGGQNFGLIAVKLTG
jgi:Flp pilus assembly protein TadG